MWAKTIHKEITQMFSWDPIILDILKRYGFYNPKDFPVAYQALLRGCVYPDEHNNKKEGYTAGNGWHGVWNGWYDDGTKLNVRLKEMFIEADKQLKKGMVSDAFFALGKALHTIQDCTAHFMYGVRGVGKHDGKGDSLKWDFVRIRIKIRSNVVNTSWWEELKTNTIAGNRRAKLARRYCLEYLTAFRDTYDKSKVRFYFSASKLYTDMGL